MNGEASHLHQPSSSSASIIIIVMPIRDGWRHHAFHPSGFRPLGLCLRHPQVTAFPSYGGSVRSCHLEHPKRRQLLANTSDVDGCGDMQDDHEDIGLRGHMHHRGDISTSSGGRCLDRAGPPLLNHVWMEPPLRHEDTGRARLRDVIESGMVGLSPGLSAYGVV